MACAQAAACKPNPQLPGVMGKCGLIAPKGVLKVGAKLMGRRGGWGIGGLRPTALGSMVLCISLVLPPMVFAWVAAR